MLCMAGIRHADRKWYTYSREDVTAKSLANASSQSIGSLFSADPKPLEVELLVVEVGQDGKPNELYRISFDGSIIDERGVAVIRRECGSAVAMPEKPVTAAVNSPPHQPQHSTLTRETLT